MQRVYLVTLAKDTESPLGPRSDEVGKAEKKDKDKDKDESEGEKKDGKKEEKSKKPVTVKVDTDGIQNRIVGLDITPANYKDLRLVDDRVFYLRRTVGDNSGEDEETGPGEAEVASLLLQPGGSQGDGPGRRQQLPD